MNNRELYKIAKDVIPSLEVKYDYITGAEKPYQINNSSKLRNAIVQLEDVPFLSSSIQGFKEGVIFRGSSDKVNVSSSVHTEATSYIRSLKDGLSFFIEQFESNNIDDAFGISIKLPPIMTFGDLSKAATEFKKAIEIPLLDSKIESDLHVRSSEPGSFWLEVGVGTTVALNMIAGIAWAAAVLKKKNAEADMFIQNARTLKLKNEQIELYVNAQKEQLNHILESEAEELGKQHYSSSLDSESLERLKLSISTVADLIDRGAKILPTSNESNVKELFPEYDKLSLIESAIKKISKS